MHKLGKLPKVHLLLAESVGRRILIELERLCLLNKAIGSEKDLVLQPNVEENQIRPGRKWRSNS